MKLGDWELLRAYAEEKSEAAFAQLVKKHMNLVYGTCRRAVGDAQLAEDAALAVFVLLAQKAKSFRGDVSLTGWLFNVALLISRNTARGERRRRAVEQEAARNMDQFSGHDRRPGEIEPWLNDALAALTPGEREVVLLRYFDDMSFHEIAKQIGTIENTAAKRARYAVEKMRRYLLKKDVVVSSAALTALLATQRTNAAPASCHDATLQAIHQLTTGQAVLAAGSHLAMLHKGVYIMMQVTKYKIAMGIGVAVVAAVLVTGAVRHHAQVSRVASTPPVLWVAAHAVDPATRAVEQQIQAQLGQFIHGFNSRNPSEIRAVMTLDCISTGPAPAESTYLSNDIANVGNGMFVHQAPDANIKAKIRSCRIDGNAAVVDVDILNHGTNSRQEGNGADVHDVYSDDISPSTMTFVNTGGQWLMTRMETISHTTLPYQAGGG
jgi:RNA polymerase sigma factor (sigma-70 family)